MILGLVVIDASLQGQNDDCSVFCSFRVFLQYLEVGEGVVPLFVQTVLQLVPNVCTRIDDACSLRPCFDSADHLFEG